VSALSASPDAAATPAGRVPRVSLGFPVYNGERYLRGALDSVLAQDFDDFELVICDNASTDATGEICREVASRDPRIRYFRNEQNIGISPNFRRVFELSRAPYFKWVVHDDLLAPSYLSRCVEWLDRAGPEVALVYPRTLLIDGEGREIGAYDDFMDLREARPHERLHHLFWSLGFNHCGLGLIRADVLRRTRLEGAYESADLVLLVELALRGQFWEHPEPLYRRRVHEGSSFGTYTTPESYAVLMDPANAGSFPTPRTKLFVECLRAIHLAPVGTLERLRCVRALLVGWGPRYWRVVAGELRLALLHRLGLPLPPRPPYRRRPRRRPPARSQPG
jgi:glycosyltransferase involved in cell wall biosynthesis